MLGWMTLNSIVSALAGAGVVWALMRTRFQFAKAAAQAQFESLESQFQALERAHLELKTAQSQLQERHLVESTARATAQATATLVPELQRKLDEAGARTADQAGQIATLQAEMLAGQRAIKEQRDLLDQAQAALANSFKALSADALNSNNQAFLQLAKSTFDTMQEGAKGDLQARQVAMDQMVQPIRDSLTKVDSKLGAMEVERVSAYSALHEQLKGLVETHLPVLRKETSNLVKALRQPNVRGRYGEVQLKRVVEMAGMLDHCDFMEQENRTTEEGRLRPDMIVKLPGGRNIVVDAKTPISAYLEAAEAPDEESQRLFIAQHAQQFRQHITALGRKAYWDQFSPTPEMVVMFVPGESIYSAALQADPTLLEYGAQERVILTTPATLIAALRAVAYGWRQEKLADSAEEVAKLGKELYERIATLAKHWGEVGDRLGKAVDAYNNSTATMESRVLVSARRFRDLKVSSDVVEIRPSKQVEVLPRLLQVEEMVSLSVPQGTTTNSQLLS